MISQVYNVLVKDSGPGKVYSLYIHFIGPAKISTIKTRSGTDFSSLVKEFDSGEGGDSLGPPQATTWVEKGEAKPYNGGIGLIYAHISSSSCKITITFSLESHFGVSARPIFSFRSHKGVSKKLTAPK